MTWCGLEAEKRLLLSQSLAPSTIKTYSTGVRHFFNFCQQFFIPVLPIEEVVLENFASSMAHRVGFNTIKVYLCGIQTFSIVHRCPVKIRDMTSLKYVLRGIKRSQGPSHTRITKDPISMAQLRHIISVIKQSYTPRDGNMFMAAILLAFFGMLRVSEYTAPSISTYEPSCHLGINDVGVNWQRQIMHVNIKISKTDPFREGATVRIPVLANELCPVRAMLRFLVTRPPIRGPLFQFCDGRFLTRAHITALLTRAFPNNQRISSHSFRRGGATALANSGTPDYIIQLLGRWKSDAYLQYISLPDNFSRKLLST